MQAGERIAFFTRYLPNMGGVEFFADNLSRQLTIDGYIPIVITTDKGAETDKDPFEVIRLDSATILNGRYPIPININQINSLRNHLSELGVRHFVINGRFYPLSAIGAWMGRALGSQPLVIDHSSSYVSDTHTLAGRLLALADHISTFLLNLFKPKYYCVSKLSSRWIETFGLTSSGEIHNAIDAERFAKLAAKGSVNLIDTLREPKLRVAFAGRLIPEKGIMQLVEAMSKLPSDIELYIAGSGPLEHAVAEIANLDQRIKFLGRLSHPDLARLLTICDVFCFPTNYGEGLPTCLLEAAACSCALITTNTGGTEEIIPTEDYGIVLDESKPQDIASAILNLLNNEEKLRLLKENARIHIERNFSWKNTELQLLEALEK